MSMAPIRALTKRYQERENVAAGGGGNGHPVRFGAYHGCEKDQLLSVNIGIASEQMEAVTLTEAKKLVASIPHWHHIFEIFPGLQTPGSYDPTFLWNKLNLPGDLAGKRVLDIGTSDGFFARSLAERGAEVVCVDYRAKSSHGFGVMEQLYGREFEYHRKNLYELNSDSLGKFDIILFLGVLYHLPDMMRAFGILRSLSRGTVHVETHSENEFCPDIAAARYYVHDTLSNDWTNFWAPNRLCVLDMLYDAGFDVVRDEAWGSRLFAEAKVNPDPARLKKMTAAYGVI
jgi:tRNA (mo5U34)-methyltransferase